MSRTAAALGLACALALAACGSESEPAREAKPVGQVLVGSVAQMATCSDWSAGTREQRIATIHDIRQQINLEDSAVHTPKLSDQAAYEVLGNLCRREFADSFRLYKLYARAASFAPFAED